MLKYWKTGKKTFKNTKNIKHKEKHRKHEQNKNENITTTQKYEKYYHSTNKYEKPEKYEKHKIYWSDWKAGETRATRLHPLKTVQWPPWSSPFTTTPFPSWPVNTEEIAMDFASNCLPPISVESFSPASHDNSSTTDWRVHGRLNCISVTCHGLISPAAVWRCATPPSGYEVRKGTWSVWFLVHIILKERVWRFCCSRPPSLIGDWLIPW